MKDWDDYRFALALKQAGSIRGAAQRLGVNHATVSRRLLAMNARLGTPVFERISGRYQPTTDGKHLIAAASDMAQAVYASERAAMGADQKLAGRLVLSLPDVVAQHLLVDALGEFTAMYPGIALVVQTSLGFADLDHREADVVVRITNNPPDHLVGRRLFKYARCHYCTPEYFDRHCMPASTHSPRWLAWPDDPDQPDWIKQSSFPAAPVGLRIAHPLVRHAAAIAGLGLVLDICFVADPEPGLIRLPQAQPVPDRDIWVLTHPDLKTTRRVSVLMRFLTAALLKKRDLIEGHMPPV